MSLEEYKSQLEDIDILLSESPTDESLLKLKSDLVELIQLTQQDQEDKQSHQNIHSENSTLVTTSNNKVVSNEINDEQDPILLLSLEKNPTTQPSLQVASLSPQQGQTQQQKDPQLATTKVNKKKLKKKFEVPTHLLPLDSDTDAERKRKKRTLKALKSKHKSAVKEYETEKKQSAWLDFSKHGSKKKRKGVMSNVINGSASVTASGSGSIFQTVEGGGKVGVVSKSITAVSSATSGSGIGAKRQRHTFDYS